MGLFRNKEIKKLTMMMLLCSVVMAVIGFLIHRWAGIMVIITVLLLWMLFFIYTRNRYKSLRELADYLRNISSGKYDLDIRDNKEGELSILKSEIYKVTLMLTEYNEELRKDKLLLSDQMAEISHQLKTPLTSMMMMADLLQKPLPENKRRDFTKQIMNQLERMEWLLASLLKMSQLDAGVVTMKREPVLSHQLIQDVLQPFLISMEIKGIGLTEKVDTVTILCDYKWTIEALVNILKNCTEHTPNGGHITLSVKDNPIFTEIEISDTGTGIHKEDLPHIFTRYYKGKNASSDSVGIGLAMSYRIIKSQQGDIQVKSREGKGSTFTVRLYKSII